MVSVKSLWPRLCAGVVLSLAGISAHADDRPSLGFDAAGAELYKAMQVIIDKPKDTDYLGLAYWMYVNGFLVSSAQGSAFAKSALNSRVCNYPSNTTPEQLAMVVRKKLEQSPESWGHATPFMHFYISTASMIECTDKKF